MKYTENGIVKIDFIKTPDAITYTLIDTGVGMNEAQQEQIFKLEDGISTPGTDGEKGTGLGLNLVYRFVKMHKGEIKVSSKLRLGTRFDISFPVTESVQGKEIKATLSA